MAVTRRRRSLTADPADHGQRDGTDRRRFASDADTIWDGQASVVNAVQLGYTLSSEEHDPRSLVENARLAESVGFDFVSISDHFHPWVDRQGHSPFVWSVIGGVATVTERIGLGTGVTCPTQRIHPAIIAHAAATSGC